MYYANRQQLTFSFPFVFSHFYLYQVIHVIIFFNILYGILCFKFFIFSYCVLQNFKGRLQKV